MKMRHSTISLNNPVAIRKVIRELIRSSRIRREVFLKIARTPELQKEMLAAIANNRVAQRQFVLKLARDPRLLGKLLRLVNK